MSTWKGFKIRVWDDDNSEFLFNHHHPTTRPLNKPLSNQETVNFPPKPVSRSYHRVLNCYRGRIWYAYYMYWLTVWPIHAMVTLLYSKQQSYYLALDYISILVWDLVFDTLCCLLANLCGKIILPCIVVKTLMMKFANQRWWHISSFYRYVQIITPVNTLCICIYHERTNWQGKLAIN